MVQVEIFNIPCLGYKVYAINIEFMQSHDYLVKIRTNFAMKISEISRELP